MDKGDHDGRKKYVKHREAADAAAAKVAEEQHLEEMEAKLKEYWDENG